MISRGFQQELEREARRWDLAAIKHEEQGETVAAALARDEAKMVRARLRQLTTQRPAVRTA